MTSSRSLVYVLFLTQAASALDWGFGLGLRKRDDSVFVPPMVEIPLQYDAAGRYVTSVTMNPGGGQQQFNFTMTTQSGLTYVAGAGCQSCSGTNLYNQTQSTDAQSLSSASSVPLFGQDSGASVIKEFCQLRMSNGSAWDYSNQTIVVVNSAANGQVAQSAGAPVGNNLAGLIGLGTNRNTPSSGNSSVYTPAFQDSIYGQWIEQNPTALNFSFGMMLNKPLDMPRGNISSSNSPPSAQGSAGVLHWQMPNSNAFDASKLVTKNVNSSIIGQLPVSSNSTSGADWFVSLDGWVMVSGNNHLSNTESVVATVDPLFSDLYLPQDQARLINDAIPGSQLRPDLSSLGSLSQAWSIPCNSTFSFGLVVGSQTFTVSENTLVITQQDGTCISGIEAWTDPSQTQYLFGARFLSTIYLIFQIPRDGPNSIGFAPRAVAAQSNHVGAIVGGVVGGVAFLVITGFFIFFLIYRHRSQTPRITNAQFDNDIEKPANGTLQPFPLQNPENQRSPLLNSTTGFSTISPMSPTSPSDSTGVETVMAVVNPTDDDEDQYAMVPPPTYEASEGLRSPASPAVVVRPEKSRLMRTLFSPLHTQQPPIPSTSITEQSDLRTATGSDVN